MRTAHRQTAVGTRRANISTALPRSSAPLSGIAAPFVLAGAALADTPSIEALKGLSYDQQVTPSAAKATKAAGDAAGKAAALNLDGIDDAAPLIAGLVVGIVLVGGAIAFFTNTNKGTSVRVCISNTL